MAAPLVTHSVGDVISPGHVNDIADYIENGTYRVNTLSLNIQGTGEIITSTGKLTNIPEIEIDTGGKLILDGASGNTYLIYNSTTSKVELWVDGVKKAAWG